MELPLFFVTSKEWRSVVAFSNLTPDDKIISVPNGSGTDCHPRSTTSRERGREVSRSGQTCQAETRGIRERRREFKGRDRREGDRKREKEREKKRECLLYRKYIAHD